MLRTLTTAALCLLTSPALPQSSGLPIEGNLLPGWREADGRHIAGIALDLAPGWKTYWRVPGAGGIPPSFNWSGSSNIVQAEVHYPVPKVMDQNGLQSIGYDENVVFPVIITTQSADAPIILKAEVDLGVCEEVCIPMTLQLTARLPALGSPNAAIAASLESQPRSAGSFDCEITPIKDGLALRATTDQASLKADIAVIEISTPGVWVSPSDVLQRGATLVAEVEMVPPNAQPFALARSDVRLTLIGEGRAVELNGCG
ncbi:MAG: protein-disulfide reductase DsbD domain-containing protein [Pseudomonadota bacterium]